MATAAAATLEGEIIPKPVGPQLSGIQLAPLDLPLHTQAIVNTSRVIWIGEESFLFYNNPKCIEQLEHWLEPQHSLGRVTNGSYIKWLGMLLRIP